MNGRGRTHYTELKTCPVCGMDSGVRKATATVPEKFLVICGGCGYRTKLCATQSSATKEWNGGKHG